MMKPKKSLMKRLKVTRTGKILGRKPDFNHFNAKMKRNKQLAGRKMKAFPITNKDKATFLPGIM